MSSEDESAKRRKRYAEDPEYRERIIAASRAFREKNRDKINQKAREKRKAHPELQQQGRDAARVRHWHSKYKLVDMTIEHYGRMLDRQHGVCKICKTKQPSKSLCIDHRHATGRVRGLLCNKCNFGLGYFDDNPVRMVRAAIYVVIDLVQETASRLLLTSMAFCRRTIAARLMRLSGKMTK
jgi:Autographiviridae endonuclease VII